MHQTFDKSVPVSTQRYLVAIKACVRKHKKRHRTGKRKSALYRARKAKVAARLAKLDKEHVRFKRAVVAYWQGASEEHP